MSELSRIRHEKTYCSEKLNCINVQKDLLSASLILHGVKSHC